MAEEQTFVVGEVAWWRLSRRPVQIVEQVDGADSYVVCYALPRVGERTTVLPATSLDKIARTTSPQRTSRL